MAENKQEFRHLVRIANTDLDGNKPILQAMRKIKGVNFMLANAVCSLAGIDFKQKAGNMDNKDVSKIQEILDDPLKFKIPKWMINRRVDYETGKDMHLFGGDLKFAIENDIKRMKKVKSYRGMRHAFGLTVRGQKTKANFRRNKGKVAGVKKKAGSKPGRV
mgnify:CR=1 FL=1